MNQVEIYEITKTVFPSIVPDSDPRVTALQQAFQPAAFAVVRETGNTLVRDRALEALRQAYMTIRLDYK